MSRKCLVCTHNNRLDAERLYLRGESISKISLEFGISPDSVRNHMLNHLSRQMTQAFKKKSAMEAFDMMNEFTTLMADIKQQIETFKKKGKDSLSIKATDTLIRLYQTMAQFASVFYQIEANEKQQDKEAIRREIEQENKVLINEMLDVLNKAEQDMYFQLNLKMTTYDASRVVIPQKNEFDLTQKSSLTQNRYIDIPSTGEPTLERTKMPSKRENTGEKEPEEYENNNDDHALKVKPIEPDVIIPSTETDSKEVRKRVMNELRNIPPQRRE